MRTVEELRQSVHKAFPVVFGKAPVIDVAVVTARYEGLLSYAGTISEPFMKPETLRYQSMLLYVSLVFGSLSLFNVKSIKLNDMPLAVNVPFQSYYTAFVAMIVLIFLLKARFDLERAILVSQKELPARRAMLDLVDVIRTKKRIHIHFWMTLFWAIVDAKERANLAYARLMSEASDPADPIMLQSRTNWFQMDTEVLSKYPEYSTDISALESELAALLEELKNDERAFFHHAELTEKEHQRMKQRGEWAALDPDYKLKNAFDQNIKVWVDASDKLTSDALETDPDMRKEPSIAVALTMLDTMERANKMRRDYRVIEIYVPVEFSVITLLVGWFLSAPN